MPTEIVLVMEYPEVMVMVVVRIVPTYSFFWRPQQQLHHVHLNRSPALIALVALFLASTYTQRVYVSISLTARTRTATPRRSRHATHIWTATPETPENTKRRPQWIRYISILLSQFHLMSLLDWLLLGVFDMTSQRWTWKWRMRVQRHDLIWAF